MLADLLKFKNLEIRLLSLSDVVDYTFIGHLSEKSVLFKFASSKGVYGKYNVFIDSPELASSLSEVFDANFRRARPVTSKYIASLKEKMEDFKYFSKES